MFTKPFLCNIFNGLRLANTRPNALLPVVTSGFARNFVTDSQVEEMFSKLPKRPRTAYVEFLIDQVKNVEVPKGARPSAGLIGLSKKWHSLSIEERSKYYKSFEENVKKYELEREELFRQVPDAELDELKQKLKERRRFEVALRKNRIGKLRATRLDEGLNKPKRPMNSFLLYAFSLDRGEATNQEFMAGAAQKWRMLPEEDKQKFERQSQEARAKYYVLKRQWEEEQSRNGYQHLVSSEGKQAVVREAKNANKKETKKPIENDDDDASSSDSDNEVDKPKAQ